MYECEISETLLKILGKLALKDPVRHDATLKKIDEVIRSDDIAHFKNLRYALKGYKRVHIDSSFVLVFCVSGRKVQFMDLQHHDDIYRRA
jgi:YafQ family addiction module toxin component